ncbi:DUF4007 family protein [uncultured Desulfobulbus sp.]|uniref:DUF4007 family protein n=1 Tax=uncultured Desulfobulbus sp. TaxID=239745 RepID=UPI0029C648D2|nr:DUF4007 family protein [uncultured Desulfobulbus sp.]
MTEDQVKGCRLPVTFHQSFIMERQNVASLLKFVASGQGGTDQDISKQTGIPVGRSSGKVPATINYCIGMGLIEFPQKNGQGKKTFELTPFGRVVLLEDNNLSENLTQWLAHLHLCRKKNGAEIWYLAFTEGYKTLGMSFTEKNLKEFIERYCGKRNRSPLGPLIRTYEETAGLRLASVLERGPSGFVRAHAPILGSFRNGYSALFLSLWDEYFPEDRQVTVTNFGSVCFQEMCGWNERQYEIALDLIQEAGAFTIDKQMRPWVLTRSAESKLFWSTLYDELA